MRHFSSQQSRIGNTLLYVTVVAKPECYSCSQEKVLQQTHRVNGAVYSSNWTLWNILQILETIGYIPNCLRLFSQNSFEAVEMPVAVQVENCRCSGSTLYWAKFYINGKLDLQQTLQLRLCLHEYVFIEKDIVFRKRNDCIASTHRFRIVFILFSLEIVYE